MADKYSTIQQHQPLRVPQGWSQQEKALIVQLDETFDDIYRRFGRLRIEDMGAAFRKRIEDDEGNIAELVVDLGQIVIDVGNKYDKVSGIAITADGIDVTGSKYVKISSGGTFEVDSTNFVISTSQQKMQSGNWTFDNKGAKLDSGTVSFFMSDTNQTVPNYSAGILFDKTSTTHGAIQLYVHTGSITQNKLSIEFQSIYISLLQEYIAALIPSNTNLIDLGSSDKRYRMLYVGSVQATDIDVTDYINTNVITANEYYGGRRNETTSTTNMNSLTDPGLYWMDTATGLTNIPSGLSGKFEVEVTTGGPSNSLRIIQKIYAQADIFIRRSVSGSWTSWYKYTGTAV